MKTLCYTFLASAIAMASSLPAQVKPFPPPPSDTTKPYPMSSYLEQKFGDQLSNCLSNPSKRSLSVKASGAFGKTYSITAIPSPLLSDTNVNLNAMILPEITDSAGRVFAYVYPSQTAKISAADDYVYLDTDYLQDPAGMLPSGTSSTLYNYSCSSNIAWQMKANASATFPVADVSTAIQADTSNTSASQLGLVFGKFNSPLWDMYNNPKNEDWKTYADLLMWSWYANHPTAVSDGVTRYLLTQFNGATAYKLSSNKENVNGTLSLSGGFSIPVASLQTGVQAAYNNTATVTATNFSVVIMTDGSGKEIDGFTKLPMASQIISDVAPLTSTVAAKLDTAHSSSHLLAAGSTHVQLLSGVPPDFCQAGRWTFSSVPNGSLSFDPTSPAAPVAQASGSTAPPGCAFRVLYKPSTAPAATDTVTLQYKLISSVGGSQLAINAAPVYLSANGKPTIDATSDHGIYTKTSTTQSGKTFDSFAYSFSYPIENDPSDPVASVGSPLTISLSCGAGGSARTFSAINATVSYNTTTNSMTLTFTQSNDDSQTTLDSGSDDQCHLSGVLSVTLQSNTALPKSIPDTLVYYPKLLVPSAPTVSPAAGTYATQQTVTLTDATAGVAIYYSVDGSRPTTASTLYTTPITVKTTQTITAIAATNSATSSATSSTYTIAPAPQ